MAEDTRLPLQVTLGELQFTCVPSGLRHIRFDGTEVLAAVQLVVRDPSWGTLRPELQGTASVQYGAGSCTVRWRTRQADGDISFAWDGLIEARSGGPGQAQLTFTADGSAGAEFLANRVGMCLLHPMWLAGEPAATRAAGPAAPGDWSAGRFPRDIAPYQPFLNFSGLRHALPGAGTAEMSLTPDAFEMEDQRNWTDASFKSYCPPLDMPHPRTYRAGQSVTQQLRLVLSGPGGRTGAAGNDRRVACRSRTPAAVPVSVESVQVGRLPVIGLGLAGTEVSVSSTDQDMLQALRPGHLHAVIDLASDSWHEGLRRALGAAAVLGCRADLEVVASDPGQLASVAAAIGPGGERHEAVGRVFVYDRESSQTNAELAAAWAASFRDAPSGGSRADFVQLNRARLPTELLSAVAFGVSPQVHATDDESIIETLAAQPAVVRCALALAPGHPLVVGPITLKQRFNPAAPAAAGPAPSDPRQAAPITAAWTAGSVAALGYAGASALTYFETVGPGGVLAGPGSLPAGFPAPGARYPVFHVLALLSPLAGRPLLAAKTPDRGPVAALAVQAGAGPLVILANLRPKPVSAVVTADFTLGSVMRALPTSATWPGNNPAAAGSMPRQGDGRSARIELAPWQIVAIGT
jgi:D-apionolactonase